jgi:hypothetical protein
LFGPAQSCFVLVDELILLIQVRKKVRIVGIFCFDEKSRGAVF